MKLKTAIILLCLCIILSGLNAQLFEAIVKKPNLRVNKSVPSNTKPLIQNQPIHVPGTSLFQNFYQKNEHKITNSVTHTTNNSNVKGSLFGQIENLNIENKKIKQKSENSIKKTLNNHINRREIDDEIHVFLEKSKKISTKIKNNEKTLSSLNSRVEELIEKNENVKNEIKKYKKLKNEKKNLESKVLNFLEKYQGEVKDIKTTILNKSNYVEKTLSEKEKNFNNIYKGVVSSYSNLQTQVDVIKEKLLEIVLF